jgi:hypothetical protein
MSFSPQLFLSNINAKEGLARPNRFEIILPIPEYINSFIGNSFLDKLLNLPNTLVSTVSSLIKNKGGEDQSQTDNASMTRYLALQCEAAELPGKVLVTADAKIYGPTFKVPYQTQYSDMTLTFICTNEFYERKLFDRWIEAIMPSDTNNLRYPKDEETRYLTNIKIIQYDDFVRQIFAIELIDAYPISIAPQTLSWSEDGFHRVSVQFAYQKYRVIYKGNFDIAGLAGALFGSRFAAYVSGKADNVRGAVGSLFESIF